MKLNFIVIPLIIFATAYYGMGYTRRGVSGWYKNLRKPSWTPSGSTIGEIWTFLYLITAFAVLWFWNVPFFGTLHYVVGATLLVNAYLNATWSKIFFAEHNFSKAYRWMIVLNLTSILAAIMMAFESPIASFFMVPYIVWVGIATKLTKDIWNLNKN